MSRLSPTRLPDRRPLPSRWQRAANTALPRFVYAALLLVGALQLGGCRVVEGIFKLGVGAGVIMVVVLVAVGGGIFAMLRKKT